MTVMIVAEPGRLREGLQAMLASFLDAEPLVAGGDRVAAVEAIRAARPDLVILDSGLFGSGAEALVRELKAEQNCTGCIVVVERVTHLRAMQDAGADHVLLKGFQATRLFNAVEQLLRQNG